MASRRCIVVSPAHLASRLTRAKQSKRPKRLMEAVSSFAHLRHCFVAAIGLQQLPNWGVRELPPTCRGRLQYDLRFADRMKRRLLISHGYLLTKQIAARSRRRKNQATFCEYPRFS
jgi:hypothetical protein